MKNVHIIFLLLSTIFANTSIQVKGRITSETGEVLPFVNIFFLDNLEGTISDSTGNFVLPTVKSGERNLRISHIGYEQIDIPIIVEQTMSPLEIVLQKAFMEMDPVTVSAGSFTMADEEGQTLSSMDVVTTAGAAADIFRAIQTLPGVNQVDEGAGMYVRGGDVSETTVILDQATISHPYKYESDTGGYFGMINPFLLSGTYFSSGGFSAKYGNVLSGVLAMESLDLPTRSSISIGMGLAALSLGGSKIIISDKLGIQFSGNYSDTQYLFKVNGGEDRFEKVPISWDGNFSAVCKYSPMGQFKFFHYSNLDEIGVKVETPSFDGIMLSDNSSHLSNVQWKHLFNNGLVAKSSLSLNQFNQGMTMGNFNRDMDDILWKWRTDLSLSLSENFKINAGVIADDLKTVLSMTFPTNQLDLSDTASLTTFDIDYTSRHYGLYTEGEMNLSKRLFTTIGLRSDILDNPRQTEFDPRLSLNYRLSESQFLKLATGVYHQYPKAQYRDEWNGNPDLKAMKATHAILGYEYKAEITNLKVELYQKNYTQLVLDDSLMNYSNGGHGFAYGADVFLKGQLPWFSGWTSYSYLQSERKELDHLKLSPTDFDINHNFTAALKMNIFNVNTLSLTYRYTTGKPYTPSLNDWNSERLPSMQRLDLGLSRVYFFGTGKLLVLYGAISNVLDKQNIYGYIYSPDYSERTELKSTHGRNIYFGFSLNL